MMPDGRPGLSPAVSQAIAARGQGQAPVGQLNQQSTAPLTPAVPAPSTPSGGPPSMSPQPSMQQEDPIKTENQLIIKSLGQKLSMNGKVELQKVKPAPSLQSAPVGF